MYCLTKIYPLSIAWIFTSVRTCHLVVCALYLGLNNYLVLVITCLPVTRSYQLPITSYQSPVSRSPLPCCYQLPVTRGPFLESPGKFSGSKSHFQNHEAFDVQTFLCQQVLHLSKAYTYATFRIKNLFGFSVTVFQLKLVFRARKLSRAFEKRGPDICFKLPAF